MKETIIYSLCMMISTMVEIYLAFDFYKAFHPKKEMFMSGRRERLFAAVIVLINTITNLQHNNKLNFIVAAGLYLLVGLLLVEGNMLSRIFHWVLLILSALSAEFIFFFLLNVSVDSPTNAIYENEFVMISSIIAMKIIEFIILSVIKQASQIQVKKVSARVFAIFVLIPVATLGLMAVIPYLRVGGEELALLDIVVLVLYLILLCGNVCLFYIFTQYSHLQEEKMLLEVSQAKYEERKHRHSKEKELEQRYQGRIHDIKYYLKQIHIYANENRINEIQDVLNELQIDIYQEEQHKICANRFLNALLIDFRGEAEKNHVKTDIFVEVGFKIEYMKEIDITSLLGNLLDNALEASKKCEKREIKVNLYMENQGDIAVLLVENSYDGNIIQRGNRLLTTKKEKQGHGIGLQNVKRIVETYHGFMQQEYDDDRYRTTIIIPVSGK